MLNIFPSIDTGICAASVRYFNQQAASLKNTVVLCVSEDLPFAQDRFCGAEGINDVITVSAFRSNFGQVTGLKIADSPMAGLLARCLIVLDEQSKVIYCGLCPEIKQEPDYQGALETLGQGLEH